ncbi:MULTISPECIES: mandelate racemase/muconate lactonizing enzyme family protein [Haloferax]|uniref:Mandelate racemase/muconate lactonizing enzyme family protein n=1 Tax=Haloferax marinum TaxID=2666143 RepID=A0A6A8GBQ5_9EURY|nr:MULTISPECIES: mandelate racemase/muconate lactonizing enzyme family protein [Haloferax]KAB1190656.1 mandelate racemase/muconate lactonizing enzyme family protein [Haloferax sp. CBA1150]MRW98185.1 mandelate racemase/muconate lactonizing enzyme family protein [Haloferax marinum]
MRITEVESYPVEIPLESPVSFSNRTLTFRDHAITHIRTDTGLEGVGYSLGYEGAGLVAEAVESLLAPLLVGEDPRDTERLWHEMYDGNVQIGRAGLLLRAISTVDIALWDLKAKASNQPLHKLLGGYTDTVPTYASGGYYRDDKGHEGLRAEMRRYLDEGHDTVKMKVGRRSVSEEVDRVAAVRDELGPDRTLLLDANGVWSSPSEAIRACRAFEPYEPYFIEEPVMIDKVETMAKVNDALSYPVATGELEGTRHRFARLHDSGAAGILQPDATVCGGITEWLRIANYAAAYDIPIAPHYNWNLHASLLGAIENGLFIEYFYRDMDVKVFDDIVADPLRPNADGEIELPDTPGHGVPLDEHAIDQFRV